MLLNTAFNCMTDPGHTGAGEMPRQRAVGMPLDIRCRYAKCISIKGPPDAIITWSCCCRSILQLPHPCVLSIVRSRLDCPFTYPPLSAMMLKVPLVKFNENIARERTFRPYGRCEAVIKGVRVERPLRH
mgnify:CR=1 FL=1